MWPPQRGKTWRTPACRRVRATSCPPVRSAMSSLAARSARPESRDDLGGDRFVLGALVARIADGAHDEVVAAGGPEPLELLGALLGRADDAVALGERLEVLRVALAEDADPCALGGLIVAADRDEHQVRRRELVHRAARGGPCGAAPLEGLRVPLGLPHVRHPAHAPAARPGQPPIGGPAPRAPGEML